jgi:hypothetical protein
VVTSFVEKSKNHIVNSTIMVLIFAFAGRLTGTTLPTYRDIIARLPRETSSSLTAEDITKRRGLNTHSLFNVTELKVILTKNGISYRHPRRKNPKGGQHPDIQSNMTHLEMAQELIQLIRSRSLKWS